MTQATRGLVILFAATAALHAASAAAGPRDAGRLRARLAPVDPVSAAPDRSDPRTPTRGHSVDASTAFASCTELETWLRARAAAAASARETLTPWWVGEPVPATHRPGDGDLDLVALAPGHLYALTDSHLRVVRTDPMPQLVGVASIPLQGTPAGLLVRDGLASVVTRLAATDPQRPPDLPPCPTGFTKVTTWSVDDPSRPRVAREDWYEGALVSAREVDGRLVLVLDHVSAGPALPATHAPWTSAWLDDALRTAEASELDDWLPQRFERVREGDAWMERRARAVACGAVQRDADDGLRMTVVVALSPARGTSQGAAVAAAQAALVGGHAGTVVVAVPDGADATSLHALAVDPTTGRVDVLGSGTVPGRVTRAEALDARGGTVRAVTFRDVPGGLRSTSLHVLAPEQGRLELVGDMTGLGPGDILRAVRYTDDMAFVVTFPLIEPRACDPFYAIDLAFPHAPVVLGEVRPPGWSEALHVLPDGAVMGLGPEVDVQAQRLGLRLSRFDVSGAYPTLAASLLVPDAVSPAEADLRAFTSIPGAGLVAFGVDAPEPSLALYRVDSGGLFPAGALPTTPPGRVPSRAVVVDGHLVAVSSGGIVASRLDDPAVPVAREVWPW